jgi:hypothetical protein
MIYLDDLLMSREFLLKYNGIANNVKIQVNSRKKSGLCDFNFKKDGYVIK